ncbi:MAG: dipeptidase [Thermodesulfobacteriota bacterium]
MKTKKRFFVDCHQDIAYSIRANKRFFDSKDKNYMITLDETLNSGLSLIFSTIFVSHVKKDKRFQEATLQFKEYERIFKEHAYFYKVETRADIDAKTKNKIALLFLMEGADPIRNLSDLDMFYDKGLRVLGLTWNKENNYAFGASKTGPLKREGYKLIEAMNYKKITLDLSHLSYESFWGAINCTKLVPIASHSNSYFLRRHRRNLTASQLRAISDKGGTTGIVLYNNFITKKSSVSISDVYTQFKYLLSKCGEDHIALGSDIDGAPIKDFPKDIRKSSDLYKILEMLEKKKVNSRIIDKFAGQNVLRVLNENLF